MSAILFGSISTLVDSSELQRRAFNTAFSQHGLDWSWDQEEYAALLTGNGGQDRVAAYAEQRGDDVDAAAVHATKSEVFRTLLAEEAPEPRAGVIETIRAAKEAGHRLGFVTTTSADNVAAVLKVPGLSAADFDVVVDADDVDEPKPAAEAYRHALAALGEHASDAVAVEDNTGGVASARAAGLPVVAFPNTNTADHDWSEATERVDALELDDLLRNVGR
ncbi:HAD family phosphatase [Aeromicrobium sp. CnD17-E]|uniref:HAD family hydrolase n=1 Tax=Aeromicrobium sp. CnD17-E TaxID=2954487 RepID=UPI002097C0B2|nr:HAD-IA family hydrolase [Aeromicrobium sp. CnD17-E]MCO7241097.1 HAD-IA family hydrolase [Aeromicrobium sp. CnD17-E]